MPTSARVESAEARLTHFTRGYWKARGKDHYGIAVPCVRFEGKPWVDCGDYYERVSDDGWKLHSWPTGMTIFPMKSVVVEDGPPVHA